VVKTLPTTSVSSFNNTPTNNTTGTLLLFIASFLLQLANYFIVFLDFDGGAF
jgi:hypothetical protein